MVWPAIACRVGGAWSKNDFSELGFAPFLPLALEDLRFDAINVCYFFSTRDWPLINAVDGQSTDKMGAGGSAAKHPPGVAVPPKPPVEQIPQNLFDDDTDNEEDAELQRQQERARKELRKQFQASNESGKQALERLRVEKNSKMDNIDGQSPDIEAAFKLASMSAPTQQQRRQQPGDDGSLGEVIQKTGPDALIQMIQVAMQTAEESQDAMPLQILLQRAEYSGVDDTHDTMRRATKLCEQLGNIGRDA